MNVGKLAASAGWGLCCLLIAGPYACAQAGFDVSLTVDLGPDTGQHFGSLFEVLDADKKPVAGAGFLSAYNTQDRSDRRLLHFYLKAGVDAEFKPHALPRPSADAGTYLFGLDNQLFAMGRTGGTDRQMRVWHPRHEMWRVDDATLPFSIRVAQEVLSVQPQRIGYAGRTTLELPSEEGTIGEPYYSNGFLVFRHRNPAADPPVNRLVACPWTPQHNGAVPWPPSAQVAMGTPNEFVYAYGQLGRQILAVTNTGGVYQFNETVWRTILEPDTQVSYQVYAAMNFRDKLLLGHYPSGELIEYDGHALRPLKGQPPVMPGVSPHARELQTLAIYGGDVYAGIWPWGEVWRLDESEKRWTFLGRMFTHPEPTSETVHPYEEEAQKGGSVLNLWGQRITSLAPWGDSLYIATSAKSTVPSDRLSAFLPPEQANEYGAVYRYQRPGCLAAPFQWINGPTTFRFQCNEKALTVWQDGKRIGTTTWAARPDIPTVEAIRWGQGVFGPFRGRLVANQQAAGRPVSGR